jgi:tight adherence protein C
MNLDGLTASLAGMNLNWELGGLGVTSLMFVVLIAAGARALLVPRRDEVIERIDRLNEADDIRARLEQAGAGGVLAKLLRPFARLLRPTQSIELTRLRTRLQQAGMRSDYAMELFLASKLLLACAATLTFLYVNSQLVRRLAFPMDVAVAVWTCAAFYLAPSFWLSSRISTRKTWLERALPDAMDLLVTCVEAGLGLDAALARVSDEIRLASPLLAQEMNVTFLEIQAGIPRRDAFRRLSERTGVEDLRQLSAVLTQTEMFGTSIAKALRVHADSMRIKRMQRAEEKAASVGVKMTLPLIMCILPSLIAVVLGPAIASMIVNLK